MRCGVGEGHEQRDAPSAVQQACNRYTDGELRHLMRESGIEFRADLMAGDIDEAATNFPDLAAGDQNAYVRLRYVLCPTIAVASLTWLLAARRRVPMRGRLPRGSAGNSVGLRRKGCVVHSSTGWNRE